MEIVVPVREFHSANTTPFTSTPSSPKSFDFYYHYPTASAAAAATSSSPLPNGKDHLPAADDDDDFDFDFNFSGQLVKGELPELTAADELFEKGKILPLKFPLRHCSPAVGSQIAGKDSDPFSASMAEADREGRGRNRAPSVFSSRSRKGSRSLSPLRNSGESDRFQAPLNEKAVGVGAGDGGSSRKWCFKDLLLFRSASEGRATGNRAKDRLRKYTAACSVQRVKKEAGGGDDSRGSSFRSVDGSNSARRGSAGGLAALHAAHYTTSRAAAEDMRKKTALPYKEGFLSFLPFRRR